MKDVNLNAVKTIKKRLKVKVGYSDHTIGSDVAVSALAMGATVIEKHFTLDKNLLGPDHKASLNPKELNKFIKSLRNIEISLGSNEKKPNPHEIKNILAIRKSIVASRKISKNETFSDKNITTKRPGSGINPMEWDNVIGKISEKNYLPDEPIK